MPEKIRQFREERLTFTLLADFLYIFEVYFLVIYFFKFYCVTFLNGKFKGFRKAN